MANHVRRQIRDAAVTALTGLATSGTKVYASRVHPMQDANLPGLRVYTNDESAERSSLGNSGLLERSLDLVVEACAKVNDTLDDTLDDMIKEVEQALGGGLAPANIVTLANIEIEMDGEGEKDAGVAKMTFQVMYHTAVNVPDLAQ